MSDHMTVGDLLEELEDVPKDSHLEKYEVRVETERGTALLVSLRWEHDDDCIVLTIKE